MALAGAGDILALVRADRWMMQVIAAVRELDLPDWWIGAGFVRARVWDVLHGRMGRTELDDVDVICFDPTRPDPAYEAWLERRLSMVLPDVPWSVKNQARMHLKNGDPPYRSSEDAVAHWLETATCVCVTLDGGGGLRLMAPYGLDDLLGLRLRPTPAGRRRRAAYDERLARKNWPARWPCLDASDSDD